MKRRPKLTNIPSLPANNLLVKAVLKVEGSDTQVPVKFNPENYNVTSSPNLSKRKVMGVNGEHIQFISGGESVLSMLLHFDTYHSPMRADDVRLLTSKLTELVQMNGELHRLPYVTFVYGTFIFKGIVTKADQKFTMFSRLGIPVRCELTFEITKTFDADDKQAEPKESSDRTKVRTLLEGDQLWMLAHKEYDSCDHWRKIADANNVDNPRLLKNKKELTVPVLES